MKRLTIIALLLLTSLIKPYSVLAGQLKISLSELPGYRNTSDFRVYYTYLETDGKAATVNLYIQKDGQGWRQTKDDNKTTVSGFFQLEGSDLYDGEGKYNFYAKAVTSDQTVQSTTTSTTLDNSSPDSPSEYGKERINNTTYKLSWKNPNNEDFAKVIIYRSENSTFNADESTKVGEMGGGKEEKITFNDGSIQDGKDYFYVIRAVDHAGNGSGLAGDLSESSSTSTTTPEGEAVGAGETIPGQEYSASQGQILGEEETEEISPSDTTESEATSEEKTQSRSFWWWLLPGGAIALLGAKKFLKKEDK